MERLVKIDGVLYLEKDNALTKVIEESEIEELHILETPVTRTAIINQQTTEAVYDKDVNKVLPRFEHLLGDQNIKGLNDYGQSLIEAKLPLTELLEHAEREAVDLWQYLQAIRYQLENEADEQQES